MTRRSFLLAATSVVLVPRAARSGDDSILRIVDLGVELPALLIFPECRKQGAGYCTAARVEALRLESDRSRVVLELSNGKRLPLEADASYATAASKPVRERAVLKSIAAWTIDGTRRLARGVPPTDFDALQEQTVLEAVTPRSLFDLVERLRKSPATRITWSASAHEFVVR
jgi:hypothetical protein